MYIFRRCHKIGCITRCPVTSLEPTRIHLGYPVTGGSIAPALRFASACFPRRRTSNRCSRIETKQAKDAIEIRHFTSPSFIGPEFEERAVAIMSVMNSKKRPCRLCWRLVNGRALQAHIIDPVLTILKQSVLLSQRSTKASAFAKHLRSQPPEIKRLKYDGDGLGNVKAMVFVDTFFARVCNKTSQFVTKQLWNVDW